MRTWSKNNNPCHGMKSNITDFLLIITPWQQQPVSWSGCRGGILSLMWWDDIYFLCFSLCYVLYWSKTKRLQIFFTTKLLLLHPNLISVSILMVPLPVHSDLSYWTKPRRKGENKTILLILFLLKLHEEKKGNKRNERNLKNSSFSLGNLRLTVCRNVILEYKWMCALL